MAGYLRLGDLLVSIGVLSDEQLKNALALQKGTGKRLGEVLIDNNFISEKQLIDALQLQLGVNFVDLTSVEISSKMAQVLPRNIAKKYNVVPLKMVRDELYLAMADPLDFIAIEDVRAATQKKVIPVIATRAAVARAITNLYGNESTSKAIEEIMSTLDKNGEDASGVPVTIGEEDPNAAPTIRLVNSILERAVSEGASDIHIEPREGQVMVRMRVDGVLRSTIEVPRELKDSVISRIKIMGGMDVSKRRKPQDGRANVRMHQNDIDLRISTLPTIYGEKVTIRVLRKSSSMLTMAGIGLRGGNMAKFQDLIHKNANGVILIVGPTGSGKSSSMYTMLRELNTEEVNIVTLEDPVEYNIDGINQVQIDDKTGMTFANGLRSILRQDPDIISVGEIRDSETAEIAIRAAITGHLVLSTIHTGDAISTIDRLVDIGVEPFMISEALRGVISQRLVRKICPTCRRPYTPTEDEEKMLGIPASELGKHQFYKGEGCPDCFHTGYRGRTAVFEILMINYELREAIRRHAASSDMRQIALQDGFSPIHENAWELVFSGETTAEEAIRAIHRTDV